MVEGQRPLPTAGFASPFTPSFKELVTGETVVDTDAQMKAVWNALFAVPCDPALFDFDNEFVVLMGGGLVTIQSFNLSSVETVTATWNGFFSLEPDEFLAVTATTFLPGVPPPVYPPPEYVVSAARVSKAARDDVVFHRAVVAAP